MPPPPDPPLPPGGGPVRLPLTVAFSRCRTPATPALIAIPPPCVPVVVLTILPLTVLSTTVSSSPKLQMPPPPDENSATAPLSRTVLRRRWVVLDCSL